MADLIFRPLEIVTFYFPPEEKYPRIASVYTVHYDISNCALAC